MCVVMFTLLVEMNMDNAAMLDFSFFSKKHLSVPHLL